ncbi:MAG TPA: alpha/beta hydrolase-fold protein [Candidatus Nanopelagicales bacterium]
MEQPAGTPPAAAPRPAAPRPGPRVDPATGDIEFRVVAEPHWRPQRIWYHLRHAAQATFHHDGDQWVARLPRPPVDRLEYLLSVRWPDGTESLVPDPSNPRRVRGVFGDKSVVELPDYSPPWWLAVADAADAQARRDAEARAAAHRRAVGLDRRSPAVAGARAGGGLIAVPMPGAGAVGAEPGATAATEGVASVRVAHSAQPGDDRWRRSPIARARPAGGLVTEHAFAPDDVVDPEAEVAVTGHLLVPEDSRPGEPLPLLVVHDGPEYAEYADLVRYLTVLARIEPQLRCRVLLLAPVDRDRSYSASPAYARALVTRMLPQVTGAFATRGPLVGVGSSLGGLAMLHAAVAHPATFGGVFSQSGSFFRPRTDDMERGYRYYGRIVRFVDDVDAEPARLAGLRVALTCGTGEENLANNRALARRLTRLGVPTVLLEHPDGHNHTGWRDSLDPGLRTLLQRLWAPA